MILKLILRKDWLVDLTVKLFLLTNVAALIALLLSPFIYALITN